MKNFKHPDEDIVFDAWVQNYKNNLKLVGDNEKEKATLQSIKDMVQYFLQFDTIKKEPKRSKR